MDFIGIYCPCGGWFRTTVWRAIQLKVSRQRWKVAQYILRVILFPLKVALVRATVKRGDFSVCTVTFSPLIHDTYRLREFATPPKTYIRDVSRIDKLSKFAFHRRREWQALFYSTIRERESRALRFMQMFASAVQRNVNFNETTLYHSDTVKWN